MYELPLTSPLTSQPLGRTGSPPQGRPTPITPLAIPRAIAPRVALYSHDAVGLGHMRRNLLIARALSEPPIGANVLLIAGSSEIQRYPKPPRVDCLTLPGLCKLADGDYGSRNLELPLHSIVKLRAQIIDASLGGFEPDVLIVDKLPEGLGGELRPALCNLRTAGRTHLILGLRDLLDEPSAVRREWARDDTEATIQEFFEEVWVYGDRELFDLGKEYGVSTPVSELLRYLGYLDRVTVGPSNDFDLTPHSSSEQIVLCMLGGGEDGSALAQQFAATALPANHRGVLLCGPFMPEPVRAELRRKIDTRAEFELIESCSDPTPLLQSAAYVLCMGGYNSLCEVLAYAKPALVVPRVRPRREQWIRAERFAARGLVSVCHPDELSPEKISTWLSRELRAPAGVRERLDMRGLERLVTRVSELLGRGDPVTGTPDRDADGVHP